ncbi:MAG: SRPBCC family protein [bacterium]|nr:SRPBCC family protein [bacterium]
MQNTIVREITIKASKESIYKAITDPELIISWFPDKVEGKLEVGERPILDFGVHGKNQIYVESARPYTYFAYRWIPGSSHFLGDVLTKPNTLVEFYIEESEGKSRVTVKESGFASLPAEIAEQCFNDNSGGWEYMIGRLEKVMKNDK